MILKLENCRWSQIFPIYQSDAALARSAPDYWTLQWIMVGKHDAQFDAKVAQMRAQRIAIMREYQFVKQLKKDFPQHKIIEVDSLIDGLDMVASGQADFVLDTVVSSGIALRDPRYLNLRAYLPTGFTLLPFLFWCAQRLT